MAKEPYEGQSKDWLAAYIAELEKLSQGSAVGLATNMRVNVELRTWGGSASFWLPVEKAEALAQEILAACQDVRRQNGG